MRSEIIYAVNHNAPNVMLNTVQGNIDNNRDQTIYPSYYFSTCHSDKSSH